MKNARMKLNYCVAVLVRRLFAIVNCGAHQRSESSRTHSACSVAFLKNILQTSRDLEKKLKVGLFFSVPFSMGLPRSYLILIANPIPTSTILSTFHHAPSSSNEPTT